ncbi:hypothetical protein A3D77_02245 [Candidatus Gottesmanbacteria bacterium RIFCSPHIGHO2_02_FULL_39_11]|uniref:Serine aminopeptidase S33 domain-containing protein n=1 Tax=Candidatus Gottesmanbacteria bacterium RIFCSPHIGHO2_02_FULL_39_11 TaxID=1798382 RepID=A0A1F5ZUV4_9BACT|nr:MAG: hypothetical protein A3D77_02245 [Candidatus Gottesmanbacteria bacterium RIFCSPHIGHO2_02_FULL_39_11]
MDKLPSVIILPGWRVSSNRYTDLKERFNYAGYLAYVFGFAGFEPDKPLDRPMSLADYALDVENFIREKKIKKAVLIGHSFGGRVGILLAGNDLDWLSVLVLTGTPGFVPVNSFKRNLFLILSKIGKLIFSFPILNIFSSISKKILYRLSGSVDYLKVDGNLKKTFQSVIREDLEPFMKKIKVPTLLIWGEDDSMVSVSIARKMKKTIINSHIEVISNGTHGIPFNNAEEFYKLVEKFI